MSEYHPLMSDPEWPELPRSAWEDTRFTLHMWMQIVGKVALAQAAPLNHSWGVAFQVTARGLSTRPLPHGHRSFTMEFDFISHELVVRTSDGSIRALALGRRTVADFYREVMALLRELSMPVKIWPVAVELPTPLRLDEDTTHRSYDPVYANRFWQIVAQAETVLSGARCDFVGKCSPTHFFWGAMDLAVSRFSGRRAPPREGQLFMREAYSHEVISHGFWPGSGPVLEPSFYAYAVPEPRGFKTAAVAPGAAHYHTELGEFLLPYDAVRTAKDATAEIRAFVTTTYERAAVLGGWDRAALERARA
jgi:hypothetical protein